MLCSIQQIALESKSWEDILYIQVKLEQLSSKYLSLARIVAKCTQFDIQRSGSVHGLGTEQVVVTAGADPWMCPTTAGVGGFCNDTLPTTATAPASLDKWVSLTKLESQVEHKKWELEYLRDIEKNVLPHVLHLLQELLSSRQTTRQAVAMIRVVHLLFELPNRPMYVYSDQTMN